MYTEREMDLPLPFTCVTLGYPSHLWSCCIQNDVTTVLFSWSVRLKKPRLILLTNYVLCSKSVRLHLAILQLLTSTSSFDRYRKLFFSEQNQLPLQTSILFLRIPSAQYPNVPWQKVISENLITKNGDYRWIVILVACLLEINNNCNC